MSIGLLYWVLIAEVVLIAALVIGDELRHSFRRWTDPACDYRRSCPAKVHSSMCEATPSGRFYAQQYGPHQRV